MILIQHNLDFGGHIITVSKANTNQSIREGQFVVEGANGKFSLATSTTPNASRGWLVYRDSPAGYPGLSLVLTGVGRVLFSNVAALNSYSVNATNYGATATPFNIGVSSTVTAAGAQATGQILNNRRSEGQEPVRIGYSEAATIPAGTEVYGMFHIR